MSLNTNSGRTWQTDDKRQNTPLGYLKERKGFLGFGMFFKSKLDKVKTNPYQIGFQLKKKKKNQHIYFQNSSNTQKKKSTIIHLSIQVRTGA